MIAVLRRPAETDAGGQRASRSAATALDPLATDQAAATSYFLRRGQIILIERAINATSSESPSAKPRFRADSTVGGLMQWRSDDSVGSRLD